MGVALVELPRRFRNRLQRVAGAQAGRVTGLRSARPGRLETVFGGQGRPEAGAEKVLAAPWAHDDRGAVQWYKAARRARGDGCFVVVIAAW
jgi:hypothetical protein